MMKLKSIILVVVVWLPFHLMAVSEPPLKVISKDSTWYSGGNFKFDLGQTSFTNWSAGGDNQLNINMLLLYNLNFKKDNINWDNRINIAYGSLFFWDKSPKKTNDKMYYSSKFGYKASKKWNYSYYWSFNSQFTNGYKYPNDSVPISRLMAPAYFLMGLGMDYKPNKNFSILISPFTYKLTIVNDAELANKGSYGIEAAIKDTAGNIITPANRFKSEPGGFVKIFVQHSFTDDFKISSRIDFFSSYKETPQNIDVNWNIFGSYKLTKNIAVNLMIDLVYDDDATIKEDINGDGIDEIVGPRTQVKESLGIGLSLDL